MPIVNCLRHSFRLNLLLPLLGGLLLLALPGRPASSQPPAGGDTTGAAPAAPAGATKAYAAPATVDRSKQSLEIKVKEMLRSGKFASDEERKTFDDYFRTYSFPRWTLAESKTALSTFRSGPTNSITALLHNSVPGEPHDQLNAMSLDLMSKLAKLNYDPAVRVNAMLLIGELNAVEAAIGKPTDIPTPLPAAADYLLAAVDDSNQLDAVRVAAMAGLLRHAKFGGLTNADTRTKVVAAMLKLVQAREVPAGRSLEGHAWMRGQAAEILGQLGTPGASAAVPNALAAMAGDSTVPLGARCTAASALGRLNYQEVGGNVNAGPWLSALAQLAIDAPQDAKASSQQRLKACIHSIVVALSGTDEQHAGIGKLASDGAAKTAVTELQAGLQAMLDVLGAAKGLTDEALAAKLAEPRARIRKLIKK